MGGLLQDSSIHSLSIPSDMPVNHYRLISLPTEWHGASVALGVAAEVGRRRALPVEPLTAFTLQHMKVIEACLQAGIGPDEKEDWQSVMDSLKDFLYIALCDTEVISIAVGVLRCVFENVDPGFMVGTLPIFMKTLHLLYPNGDDTCKLVVADFKAVMAMRPEYKEAMVEQLKSQ